jgi:hypothetical protein
MDPVSHSINNPQIVGIAIWVITLVLVATGFRLAKQIIALVLDKLYEFFVLKNPSL